jgi:hypothetical protein
MTRKSLQQSGCEVLTEILLNILQRYAVYTGIYTQTYVSQGIPANQYERNVIQQACRKANWLELEEAMVYASFNRKSMYISGSFSGYPEENASCKEG